MFMALQILRWSRIVNRIHRMHEFGYQRNNYKKTTSKYSSTVDLEDVIDNFTTELLQRKRYVWDVRNEKLKSMKSSFKCKVNDNKLDLKNLTKEKLDKELNSALVECCDTTVIALLREFLRFQVGPSQKVILQIIYICAQNGEFNLICDLETLYKSNNIQLPSNFNFSVYKAEAVWVKGHVIKALDMYQEVYKTNPFSRRYIKITLRKLIATEVKNNSEAVLMHMLKVANNLIEQHKDYFLLGCIWESCMMSELYSDQQFALKLLNEEKKLAEIIINRLPFLLSAVLKNHRKEIIYKLLECFYLLDMKEPCTIVAMAFLDYYCK